MLINNNNNNHTYNQVIINAFLLGTKFVPSSSVMNILELVVNKVNAYAIIFLVLSIFIDNILTNNYIFFSIIILMFISYT